MKMLGIMITLVSVAVGGMGFFVDSKFSPLNEKVDKNASSAKSSIERVATQNVAKINAVSLQTKTEIRKVSDFLNINSQESFEKLNLTRREAGLEPFDVPIYYPPQIGRDVSVDP